MNEWDKQSLQFFKIESKGRVFCPIKKQVHSFMQKKITSFLLMLGCFIVC